MNEQAVYTLLSTKSCYNYGLYPKGYISKFQQVTGIECSNGLVISSDDKKVIFVDGRYKTMVKNKLKDEYEIVDFSKKNLFDWLSENCTSETTIMFDPYEYTIAEIEELKSACNAQFTCMENTYNTPISTYESYEIPLNISGMSYEEKFKAISHVFENTPENTGYLLCDPLSINWLFNIRGSDTEYNPIILCKAIIHPDSSAVIYTENPSRCKYIKIAGITFKDIKYLQDDLQKYRLIYIDSSETPYYFAQTYASYIHKNNPCVLAKSIKNATELKNIRQINLIDSISIIKFLCWLGSANKPTESEAAYKLHQLRKSNDLFICDSFKSISAAGPSSSIPHYHTTYDSNAKITDIYLIDSGGQYLGGTTDVTRTVHIGNPSKDQIEKYTLVLKAHINIFLQTYPIGTELSSIDSSARGKMQEYGLNYPHGTSHGVGYISSVHEPFSASEEKNVIHPGMILSNEPGYYSPNEYGIRIENLMDASRTEGKLKFYTLTYVPYCRKMIDSNMLSIEEITWIKSYYENIFIKTALYLSKSEIEWLKHELNLS